MGLKQRNPYEPNQATLDTGSSETSSLRYPVCVRPLRQIRKSLVHNKLGHGHAGKGAVTTCPPPHSRRPNAVTERPQLSELYRNGPTDRRKDDSFL